jgi:TM2 domain-containing membrane protein YozV
LENEAARPDAGMNASNRSDSSDPSDRPHEFDENAAWSELSKLARKIETLSDADLKSALKEALQVKADKFRAQLTAIPPAAAAIPSLKELFPKLTVGEPIRPHTYTPTRPLVPPTPEQIQKVEEFLRRAHLATIRNNRAEARKWLEEAEKTAPNSAGVLEALGDEYVAANRIREARELYERAMKSAPGNVGLQKKHANAVFKTQAAAAGSALAFELQQKEAVAGPTAAMLFSLFFPGLGQIVNGNPGRGLVYMAGWLAGWITVYIIGFDHLLAFIGMNNKVPKPNILVVVAAGVAILFHIVSIFDALVRTSGGGGKAPKPPRPTPPADLPFE